VECNQIRANLVNSVKEWKYSSAYRRIFGSEKQKAILSEEEISLPKNYLIFLEKPLTEAELSAARNSTKKGTPFGDIDWRDKMVNRFKLQATIREKGRPKKCS